MPPIVPIHRTASVSYAIPSSISYERSDEDVSAIPKREPPPDINAAFPSSKTYITLTISVPRITYTTIVFPINSFPSWPSSSSPSASPIPASSVQEKRQESSGEISSNANVGIVVGCITGLVLLLGVLYVWYLRGRQGTGKKKKKKKKKEKKKENEKEKEAGEKKKKKSKKARSRRSMRARKRRKRKGKSVAVSLLYLINWLNLKEHGRGKG